MSSGRAAPGPVADPLTCRAVRRVHVLRVDLTEQAEHSSTFVLPDALAALVAAKTGRLCASSPEGSVALVDCDELVIGGLHALQKRHAGCPFRYSRTADGVEVVEVIRCWRVPVSVTTEPHTAVILLRTADSATVVTTASAVWESKWGSSQPLDLNDEVRFDAAFEHIQEQRSCS